MNVNPETWWIVGMWAISIGILISVAVVRGKK